MKNGGKNKSVVFIILVSVDILKMLLFMFASPRHLRNPDRMMFYGHVQNKEYVSMSPSILTVRVILNDLTRDSGVT